MKTHRLAAASALVAIVALCFIPSAGASAPVGNPPPPPTGGSTVSIQAAAAQSSEDSYVAIAPCRVVDTRSTNKPKLSTTVRTFAIAGKCGIPLAAKSVAVNATVISPSASGFLRVWAAGTTESNTILNFSRGQSLTSAPVLPLGAGGAISAHEYNASSDFAIDVVGYHIAPLSGTFTSNGLLYVGSGRLTGYAHSSTGYYTIRADRDLTGCVPVFSAYYYAYNVSGYASGDMIYVQLVNSADGSLADYYFHVVVTC